MRRKTLTLLGAAALLVSLAVAPRIGHDPQPVCEGQSLRIWTARYAEANQVDPTSAETESAANALRTMRNGAIPILLKWIRYEPKAWHGKVQDLVDTVPFLQRAHFSPQQVEVRAIQAERAFLALGPQGSNAVPGLLQLLADTNAPETAMRVTTALSHIGEPALLPLLSAAANPKTPNRDLALYAVSYMTQIGKRADKALPVLLTCLEDKDPAVAEYAALALGTLDLDPGPVVPALTRSLTNADSSVRERAAYSLTKYRETARPSVPFLLACLTDTNAQLRAAAAFALTNIAPEALTNAPAE